MAGRSKRPSSRKAGKTTPAPPPQTTAPATDSPPKTLEVPKRGFRPAKIYTSKPVPIDFAGPAHRYARADLEIYGIYHGGPSYEGRIFLNNPKESSSCSARWRAGVSAMLTCS